MKTIFKTVSLGYYESYSCGVQSHCEFKNDVDFKSNWNREFSDISLSFCEYSVMSFGRYFCSRNSRNSPSYHYLKK